MDSYKKKLIAEAIHWRTIVDDPDVSDDELAQFKHWIAKSDEHAQAFDYARNFWTALATTRDAYRAAEQRSSTLVKLNRFSRLHRPVLGLLHARLAIKYPTAVGFCLVVILGIAALVVSRDPTDPEPPGLELATAYGETKRIALEDGSHITLGAKSRAVVRFDQDVRQVNLFAGDAYFEVSSLASRPFRVQAGYLDVEVTGTEFDVQLNATDTHLAVAEGQVRVSQAVQPLQKGASVNVRDNSATGEKLLITGDAVIASRHSGLGEVVPVEIRSIGAWRNDRLVYAQTPLTEVLGDIERYQDLDIRYQRADLVSHTVTGSFDATNTSGLMSSLSEIFHLRITHLDDRTIVLAPELSK